MPAMLTVTDETTVGDRHDAITLEFLTDYITVRELIRERVYQEVKGYNTNQADTFRGLVQPTDAEQNLNGFKLKKRRQIDWQPPVRQGRERVRGQPGPDLDRREAGRVPRPAHHADPVDERVVPEVGAFSGGGERWGEATEFQAPHFEPSSNADPEGPWLLSAVTSATRMHVRNAL